MDQNENEMAQAAAVPQTTDQSGYTADKITVSTSEKQLQCP